MTDDDALTRFLADHFAASDLQQLVAFDDALSAAKLAEAVNFNQATGKVAFDLVQAAKARGLLPALAAAAVRARPLVPDVHQLADRFGVHGVTAVADVVAVRFAAGQFNQAFVDRRKLLGRLETYKGLHDVLHQLQTSHGELTRLVKAAREVGYDPLDAGEMPDTLVTWLGTSGKADRPPKWVARFITAAQLIAKCVNGETVPAADADRALDFLAQLPADEQGDLNERLVDAARAVDVDGLGAPLQPLSAALGPGHGADLQQRFDQFRVNCDALRRLIDDHDVCQGVDAALAEAAVLVRQPGEVPPRWDDVRVGLARLAESRPSNTTTDRLLKMLDRLREAGADVRPDWLPKLRAGFDQFFFRLDAELLDATDRVLNAADALDFRLRGYT